MARAPIFGEIMIGCDSREGLACQVAALSLQRRTAHPISIQFLYLDSLIDAGLYQRRMERRGADLWDPISGAPMSSEHAIARFLVPWVASAGGARWMLYMDGDVLVRADVREVFAQADPRYALQCVQHEAAHVEGPKKQGQTQTIYPRKNWSSVMLWNLDHPAHRRLHLRDVNERPGRELHAFCWLQDSEIGPLDPRWNHLVGVAAPRPDAALAHFTLGLPCLPQYAACEYADEWRAERALLGRPLEAA